MSKNVKVNDMTYNGVSTVELPLASGSGKAQFKDVDEINTPSGSVTITENGTHDVTNYASAVVNVESDGGSGGATTAVLLATATASVNEETNGKLVFENVTLEPRTIYAIRCTEEQTSDLYEIVFGTVNYAISAPFGTIMGLGSMQKKVNSSGNYSGTMLNGGASANADGSANISVKGTGSYHFRGLYTYNLYKIGTYPTEY